MRSRLSWPTGLWWSTRLIVFRVGLLATSLVIASGQVSKNSASSEAPRPKGIFYGVSSERPRGLAWLLRFSPTEVQRYEPPSVLVFSFVRTQGRAIWLRHSGSPGESLSFEGEFDPQMNRIVGTFDGVGFVGEDRYKVSLMPVVVGGHGGGVFSNAHLNAGSGDTRGYELVLFDVAGQRRAVFVDFENGGLPIQTTDLKVSPAGLTFVSDAGGTPESFDGVFTSEGLRLRRNGSESVVLTKRGTLEDLFNKR